MNMFLAQSEETEEREGIERKSRGWRDERAMGREDRKGEREGKRATLLMTFRN